MTLPISVVSVVRCAVHKERESACYSGSQGWKIKSCVLTWNKISRMWYLITHPYRPVVSIAFFFLNLGLLLWVHHLHKHPLQTAKRMLCNLCADSMSPLPLDAWTWTTTGLKANKFGHRVRYTCFCDLVFDPKRERVLGLNLRTVRGGERGEKRENS